MTERALATIEARLAAGDAASAASLATSLLADASLATRTRLAAFVLRSRAHEMARAFTPAIADLRAALALDSTQARLWNELGLLCSDAGDTQGAIDAFTRATTADPRYARAFNNLGNALRAAGRIADAIVAATRALDIDPRYALAWANLGNLRRQGGDDAGAETALRHAVALDARQRGAWLALGGILRERSALAEAADCFARAAALDARDANPPYQLGGTLAEADDLAGARAAFAEAVRRDPSLLRATLARELSLPMIADSGAEVAASRAAFEAGLGRLERALPAQAAGLSAERLVDELRWTNFLLAYQGGDDRALQGRYGALITHLVERQAPAWAGRRATRGAASRIRVGFASTFFRDGTVGRYFERWITELPRDDFDVHVYHFLPTDDALAQRIAARADVFRRLPLWRPSQAAPVIAADALDVLVYPELGMGVVPFALASLRLAPVQCAGWGHPVTTGLPAIDVFFSCAAMEPTGAQAHYTERLQTLPGIGTSYRMPQRPPPASRAACGLPDGGPLLLCPQSLFKIHPDNDALFARVLGAVADARLVFFAGRDPRLTQRFIARLARAGISRERLHVVAQCAHDAFLQVNSACDVMLDTLHWSGGNTSLDALACGLPVVTLPGRFMRGRQSAGMLRLMGIDEVVATDEDAYVRIAARIAGDRAYREGIAARIRAAHDALFDLPAPVEAFADRLRGLAGGR